MNDDPARDPGEVLPVLRGERLILRRPVAGDAATRLEVPRDAEEHLMYGSTAEPRPTVVAEVEARLARVAAQDLSAVREFVIAALVWPDGRRVADACGRYIGLVRLHGLSLPDRQARLAIGIFDRRFWAHGYGTEATRLVLRYGFEDLGLHRIGLRVLAYNARAIRCYEKCGFIREGVERESALVDGVWHDDVLMSILEQEYRAQADHR